MKRRGGRPELTIFATLALAAAGGCAWLAGQWRFAAEAERTWGVADALVLDARCDELVVPQPYGRTMTRRLPALWYVYVVAGEEYEGRAIAPLWLPFLDSDHYQQAALQSLAPQQSTTVRFDPAEPARSYLSLSVDRWLLVSLLLTLGGIALQSGSAWLRALHGTSGRAAPRAGFALAGVGLLLLAARHAAWGEWTAEPWIGGVALLVVAGWRRERAGTTSRAPPAELVAPL